MSQDIERLIARATINALLKIGPISVNDGEQMVLRNATHTGQILENMFSTDSDVLVVKMPDGKLSWVKFIWGNDRDCVHDHTTDLEEALKPVTALCDALEAAEG